MIDIDHFKNINDSLGHSEGDNALKILADILKKARKDREWVCRFAGDEFIVLKLSDDPNGLTAYMKEAEKLLAEYNRSNPAYQLSISYGFGYYVSGSIDSLMKEMDKKMCQMKEQHHFAMEGNKP